MDFGWFSSKRALALEELLLPALVWIFSPGLCLKHGENIPAPWSDSRGWLCIRKPQSRGFQLGQVGVTPEGFGPAPCGTGHSTTSGIFNYLRIWGVFWIATHLVSVLGLRAGCSRTPGRCPGALPGPRSCPSPTPRPPDTAPGGTTCMERGMGCASPAHLSRAQVGSRPSLREWRFPEQGKAPGLRAAVPVGLGLDRSGGRAKPLALPMESSRTGKGDRTVPTSGQSRRRRRQRQPEPRVPSEELLWGSRSCQHSQAPARTAQGSGQKDGGCFSAGLEG